MVTAFIPACGVCDPCSRGDQNFCDEGARLLTGLAISDDTHRCHTSDGEGLTQMCLLGTFAPYITVNEASLVKIEDDIPLKEAALLGCGVATGWGSAVEIGGTHAGDIVVVVRENPIINRVVLEGNKRLKEDKILKEIRLAPRQTLRRVVMPLAMPGIAAGSIFTFSLTLGDYIIPQVIGNSTLYIGQVVYRQQGVAGNLPFAAAFALVPILVIVVYLWFAKRKGAFDAL